MLRCWRHDTSSDGEYSAINHGKQTKDIQDTKDSERLEKKLAETTKESLQAPKVK